MDLIVGLGNPGPSYEATRHNAGFWWVQALGRHLGARWQADRSARALLARVRRADGSTLWLMQPQDFMNASGHSVALLARFYKLPPERILVAHDELDLPPGALRIKQGGGHAGHNGLRDIHARLGSNQYWRLRLGIGHPGDRAQVVGWVLGRPSAPERAAIEEAIGRSMQEAQALVDGQMDRATRSLHAAAPCAH